MPAFSYAFSSAFDALLFDSLLPFTLDLSPATVKRRDTHPITLTVRDSAGAPADLSGLTVRLLARPVAGGDAVVLASAVGAATGTVTHQLSGTLAPTSYHLEVETSLAGVVTTSPSGGYAILVVEPDLL